MKKNSRCAISKELLLGLCLIVPLTMYAQPFANTSNVHAQATAAWTALAKLREACVIGKVFVDCNQNAMQDSNEPPIEGVRIYMEDGTNMTTDKQGQYSICGIRGISHVLKVDPSTMPSGSLMGITSPQNLGDGRSLMIKVNAGELYSADFIESSCKPRILAQVKQGKNAGAQNMPPQIDGQQKWAVTFSSK